MSSIFTSFSTFSVTSRHFFTCTVLKYSQCFVRELLYFEDIKLSNQLQYWRAFFVVGWMGSGFVFICKYAFWVCISTLLGAQISSTSKVFTVLQTGPAGSSHTSRVTRVSIWAQSIRGWSDITKRGQTKGWIWNFHGIVDLFWHQGASFFGLLGACSLCNLETRLWNIDQLINM